LFDAGATGIAMTVGTTTVSVKMAANLKDGLSSTAASTATSGVLTGKFTSAPAITTVVAVNAPADAQGPTTGDQIVVTFDQAVNVNMGDTLTKTQIDALIALGGGSVGSSNFGTQYTGEWTSTSELTITIGSVTTGIHLVPGTTTLAIKASSGLKDALGLIAASTDAVLMIGTFTTKPALLVVKAYNTGNNVLLGNGDKIAVVFDQSTNRAGFASSATLTKAQVDSLISVTSLTTETYVIGTSYSGAWTQMNFADDMLLITIVDQMSGNVVSVADCVFNV